MDKITTERNDNNLLYLIHLDSGSDQHTNERCVHTNDQERYATSVDTTWWWWGKGPTAHAQLKGESQNPTAG